MESPGTHETFEEGSVYAAPKAALEDPRPGAAPPRPGDVERAVKCLWAVVAVGAANGVYTVGKGLFRHDPNFSDPKFLLGFGLAAAFVLGINIAFAVLIGKGANWTRILFLVMAPVGFVAETFRFLRHFGADDLPSLVADGLSFYAAILLLLRPAREWFREMKGR